MTRIMTGRIVCDSKICSISCIIQNSVCIGFVSDQFRLYFLELVINKTDMEPPTEQGESETYNYMQPDLSKACVNDCSKIKVHE